MSIVPTPIGIAVVEHQGRYLVGTRVPGSPLEGYAEFPGGKCLPGETAGVCACRECFEETGLRVRTVDLLMQRTFTYPHGMVLLHFWLCRPLKAEDVETVHQGYRWVPAAELATLRFPEGNEPLIEVLTRGTHLS
jgi:8-oxo-dGTP diphosphatase